MDVDVHTWIATTPITKEPTTFDELIKVYGTLNGKFYPFIKMSTDIELVYEASEPFDFSYATIGDVRGMPIDELRARVQEIDPTKTGESNETMVKLVYESYTTGFFHIYDVDFVNEVVTKAMNPAQQTMSLSQMPFSNIRLRAFLSGDVILIVGNTRLFSSFFENNLNGSAIFKNVYKIPVTDESLKLVGRFLSSLEDVSQTYHGYRIVGKRTHNYGILGWDTPYQDPPWLVNFLSSDWNPKDNPRVHQSGIVTFSVCTLYQRNLTCVIEAAREIKIGEDWPFKRLSEYVVVILNNDDDDVRSAINKIHRSSSDIFVAIWSGHAKVLQKRPDFFAIVDSWASPETYASDPIFNTMHRYLEVEDIELKVIPSAVTQRWEGSCAVHALARALSMCFDVDPLLRPPDEFLVMASRSIRRCLDVQL